MTDFNSNFLSPVGYNFSILKVPNVSFYSQRVNIPGVNLGEGSQATPFSDIATPGDKIVWEPLVVEFIVDVKMENYLEVFNWIQALGTPDEHGQYTLEGTDQYSDGLVQILDGNNQPVRTLKFKDCWPTGLSALTFMSTEGDVTYLQATAEFRYTTYDFEV